MLYQPDQEPGRGRPNWVKIVAVVVVAGMVLATAGAVIQTMVLGI